MRRGLQAGLVFGLAGMFLLFSNGPAHAAALKAAVAQVDITPPPGVLMWGYAGRKGPATGTLDPLYARVLVLESGPTRLALVTLDLGRCFGPTSLARLREAVRKSSHVSDLLVTASHTHSGPVILDAYPGDKAPAWETAALDKIAGAIAEACRHLVEVRLGTGYGSTYIGHNRLRVNVDGLVSWLTQDRTYIPTAPIDPTVSVLRIDTEDGAPLAILVNYACHPVIFGPDNVRYSADYPAAMIKAVEQAFGGKPLCFFLQGGAGDINPDYAATPLVEGAERLRDWTGQHLGEEAARVAKTIQTKPESDSSLQYSEDLLTIHLRWDPEKFREGIIKIFGPTASRVFAPPIESEMHLPVSTLLINKRIALAGFPGEPFVNFQVDWRARCPVPDAFFLGYTNGYYGYFPTIMDAVRGGYGAAGATTWVEVGAGERMVNRALIRLYTMLGRLSDAPAETAY